MPSNQYRDNPDYAVDVMDGAKPIGSQLVAASVLFTALLAGMSAMDVPMEPRDLYVAGRSEAGSLPAQEAGLLCSIGDKVRGWITITVLSRSSSPPASSRFGSSPVTQGIDQESKGWRGLATARVIQVVSRPDRTPILQDLDETSLC